MSSCHLQRSGWHTRVRLHSLAQNTMCSPTVKYVARLSMRQVYNNVHFVFAKCTADVVLSCLSGANTIKRLCQEIVGKCIFVNAHMFVARAASLVRLVCDMRFMLTRCRLDSNS